VETDVKVFELLQVHGIMAVTAITVQSTRGIKEVYPVSPEQLASQIGWLKEDFDFRYAKLGMVYNSGQFKVVSEELSDKRLVVDTVIYAKDGTQLIKDLEDYKRFILRKAFIVTPNALEASMLTGIKVESLRDQEVVARALHEMFSVPYVVVKGGHVKGEHSFDVVFDGKEFYEVGYPRIEQKNTHGTGSVFASAITAELTKGNDVRSAVEVARRLLQGSILYGLEVGKGIGPVDPYFLLKDSMKYKVLEEMREFGDFVEGLECFWKLIPEVQSNFSHSVPPEYVRGLEDIATFRGRIVRTWDRKVKVGYPAVFGYPTHTARLLFSLTSMGVKAESLINIRYDERAIQLLRNLGYEAVEVNRELEPQHGEGKTMQWIVEHVVENYGKVPNVIYDRGMKGKEAMIRFWTSGVEEMKNSLEYLCREL
jgi:hydroxymethylpyrimidine/phosphomethylpyrimidine kinase